MPRSPFRTVWHLWIDPDFSRIESGELPAPWVDQTRLDFGQLRDLLSSALVHEGINLRVPNDIIDMVTCQSRIDEEGADARCQDLAKRLRLEARKQTGPVIDVGKVWANRQTLPDRREVPPPMVLPMVIETDDYEEMIHLRLDTLMRLGVVKEHPVARLFNAAAEGRSEIAADDQGESHVGVLPESLRLAFQDMFGIAFHPKVMLDTASTDPLPAWAKRYDIQ
ncbi:hypothetical protein VRRI112168_02850 [Vreelandella rituensis]|uniref:Uncharacterized protein n=1 Tax=Vreelandella rituensis TaxID=2282306 RepID=A0A368UD90_9GAMM|nr:hypothetical protein [Halomonas rituensis]RCV93683.1 hypothetical protein DU506_00570 [Halomonas rituensis]